MKKIFGFASVFALAAGFSLSSCSSDDVAEEAVNPSNGAKVKTQFAISVPGATKSSRMTQEETQTETEGAVFKGMKDIKLFAFKKAGDVKGALTGAETAEEAFVLSPIQSGMGVGQGLSQTSQAKIYNDVNISTGVNHMVFYGTSAHVGQEGKLQTNVNNSSLLQLSSIYFDLVARSSQGLQSTTQGLAILKYLNDLMGVDNFNKAEIEGEKNPFYKFYENLESLTIASAKHLQIFAQLLYNGVENITPSGVQEAAFNDLKDNLLAAIAGGDKLFKTNGQDAKHFTNITWNEAIDTDGTIAQFPGNLNLPDGVASVSCHGSTFSFTAQTFGNMSLNPTTIAYPARLQYFGNSTLAVADASKADQILGGIKWSDIIKNNFGTQDNDYVVKESTRSIAMREQVQYGVARLATAVKIASGDILDAKELAVVNKEGRYDVNGILIGGQKKVGWNFEQLSSEDTWTIYDETWSGTPATIGSFVPTDYNSTLTLESGDENFVIIAVEFTNNGNDFYGYGNQVVKHGTKFYLTAKLDKSNFEGTNTDGATKVLQQDYVTKASLTIHNLKKAYVVLPDLRPSKMEFGMSVDLEWQSGYEFEQNFD